MKTVWLASYPRSGNTLLRTILWQCFGLRSASIYPNDLGRNSDLEEYVGHIEQGYNRQIQFPQNSIPLVKTHEYPHDANPAIYVIRDGRAVSVSLWKFYNGNLPLDAIIEGRHMFGSWSHHVRAWAPCDRPNTLLLEYEEMRMSLPLVLEKISAFLEKDVLNKQLPERNRIASIGGRVVKKKSDWRVGVPEELLERFTRTNEDMLRKMGYIS